MTDSLCTHAITAITTAPCTTGRGAARQKAPTMRFPSTKPSTTHGLPLRAAGFTLIELMIVVAVVAILSAVALPSFLDQIRKSRRTDAIDALAKVQQAQERWRANNPTYAGSLAAPPTGIGVSNPASGYYTLSLSGATATGFIATATAAGSQASDARCTSLSVTVANGSPTYGKTGTGTVKECWKQ